MSAAAAIAAIVNSDPDAPAVEEAQPHTLRTALAALKAARAELTRIEQAISRSTLSATGDESQATEIQRQLSELDTRIALGEATPAERETLLARLREVQASAVARRNGLQGLATRKLQAEKALDSANVEVARAAAEASRVHVERLRAGIEKSLAEAFEFHAQLLKLGRSLHSLPGADRVNVGIDPASFSFCDFTDRIEKALKAKGLRRTRHGIDAFEAFGGGEYSAGHLLALLGADVDN